MLIIIIIILIIIIIIIIIISDIYIALILYTVNSLVSGHSQELDKVSIRRAVCLRELFPKADTEEKCGGCQLM